MLIINICWFVHGRIKEKITTIYAIKYQVYCMENTVQWGLVQTVEWTTGMEHWIRLLD